MNFFGAFIEVEMISLLKIRVFINCYTNFLPFDRAAIL